jgi:predicted TPR repeat methyltransferase
LLEKSPNISEAINIRGRGLLKSGETQAALEWFEDKLKSQGNTPQLIHGAALCHLALDDIETAYRLLTQTTQVMPDYAPAWAELGSMACQKEAYKEAARYYEHAARIQPTRENRVNLAYCLSASDRVGSARKLYKILLAQYPNDPLIHNNLGKLYERIGEFDNACVHLRRSVELQPDATTPHCNMGKALLALGNLQEAIVEFETAIAIESNNYEAHFGRGQTLIELGKPEAAITAFQSVLDVKPDHELAKYCIASLGGKVTSEQVRRDFVAGLFNQYAEKFDHELVNDLKYDGPEVFLQLLQPLLTSNHDILDLGCGTGLCGPLFRPFAKRLIGVDISTKMIEKAKGRAVYDEFSAEDVASYMQRSDQEFDLIIAADVFIYIGDINTVFRTAQQAIKNNGLFAFSIETCDGTGFRFRGSGRHAHSKDYILQLAQKYHFTIIRDQDWHLRMENGRPIGGTAYVLRAEK